MLMYVSISCDNFLKIPMTTLPVIYPDWNVPANITAFTTTVDGGVSEGDCRSLNVGDHVGDNPAHVAENRKRLQSHVGQGVQLCWLRQTHSDIIIDVADYQGVVEGDASVSRQANMACVVMTADCLPVLLCNHEGSKVAALHCGWKGLYQDLIGKTIRQHFADESVIAWLGPAIGQMSYEVDTGLYQRFTALDADYETAFSANRPGHYLFDLYAIARRQLAACGVASTTIFGGDFDTFSDPRCYSFRQSAKTGRMATVIYYE